MRDSKFIKEFKNFAIKGNMVDLAIGIIIGTAFNSVINTLVNKILMPPLALITDGINFQDKKWVLRKAVLDGSDTILKSEIAIEYGTLITVLVNFFIIALCTFFVVKMMNRLRDMANDSKNTTVTPAKDIQLLKSISELMEEQNKILKELRDKQ